MFRTFITLAYKAGKFNRKNFYDYNIEIRECFATIAFLIESGYNSTSAMINWYIFTFI